MTPEQGRAFLQALGAKNIQKSAKWVSASCPLAFARHKASKDSNPSFGLTVSPDKRSRYNCFACGTGTALDLLQAMEYYQGPGDSAKAREILESESLEVIPLPEYGEFAKSEDQWVLRPWPEMWLWNFVPVEEHAPAVEYLLGRGVSDVQMIEHGLLYDAHRNMVVFPLREAYGGLAGARGRSLNDGLTGKDKHYDYSHEGIPKNVRGVWYNERALHLPGKVVVVEGQFDLMKVEQVWPKVVANMTAMPTAEKLAKLELTDGVILIPDNDSTGEKSVSKYAEYLVQHNVPLQLLALPSSVKDPGDCAPAYLADRLAEL